MRHANLLIFVIKSEIKYALIHSYAMFCKMIAVIDDRRDFFFRSSMNE